MIDDDIHSLVENERIPDLGRLETDIWQRETVRQVRRRTARRVAAWQGIVMAAAVIGSAGAGFVVTLHSPDQRHAALMMPGEQFAPSSLLFGGHR